MAATVVFVLGKVEENASSAPHDPTQLYTPVACTADMLESELGVRVRSADEEGAEDLPVVFTVSLHNTSSDNPCFIDVGRAEATIDITSGTDFIASLDSCEDSNKEHKQLLLDRDMTASFDVEWNAHRGDQCEASAPLALPGMYKGVWRAGSTAPEATATFELRDLRPQAESDGDGDGGESDNTEGGDGEGADG